MHKPNGKSASSFYGVLTQALTLGIKRIDPSKLPQFIGLVVYVALAGLIVTSFSFSLPKTVQILSVVLLLAVGVLSVVLAFGAAIHRIVLDVVVLVIIMGFLYGIAAAMRYIALTASAVQGTVYYSDNFAASDVLVNVSGEHYETVPTTPSGFFEIRFEHEIQYPIELHIQPKDNGWAELQKLGKGQASIHLTTARPSGPTVAPPATVTTNEVLPRKPLIPSHEHPQTNANFHLKAQILVATSKTQRYPELEATIPDQSRGIGFVRIGGGCSTTFSGHGSGHAEVVVESAPTPFGWKCKGADPANQPNDASVTSSVLYANFQAGANEHFDCTTSEATSPTQLYPETTVRLDSQLAQAGFVLTGGGCSSSYAGRGSAHAEPIVVSAPTGDLLGWHCQGADPANISNPASVTAHLVACKLSSRNHVLRSHLFPGEPIGPTSYPSSSAVVDPGFILSGGGCEVGYSGHGSGHAEHMVRNEPMGDSTWICAGADPPNVSNPSTSRAYAIGIKIQ